MRPEDNRPNTDVRCRARDGAGRAAGRRMVTACVAVILFLVALAPVSSAEMERRDGFFTIVDEKGREIFKTAHVLTPGDTFIAEDNRSYEVTGLSGDIAKARFTEIVRLIEPRAGEEQAPGGRAAGNERDVVTRLKAVVSGILAQVRPPGTICLYCSHSDESYTPTSGTSSKDWGDIYQVKAALGEALRAKGYRVVSSDANHNPHDGAAYERSRRTVLNLLRRRPAAIIDVHRDAVPPQVYSATVSGVPVTKVTLIVGRQNQTRGANLKFAKALKAASDRRHPGLVKGILVASGNYNQDLSGRAILAEFGADTNSLERAMEGARLFADAIPAALGATPEPRPGMSPGGSGRAIAWIVGTVLAIGILMWVMSEGSWEGVKNRIRHVVTTGLLGSRRNKQ